MTLPLAEDTHDLEGSFVSPTSDKVLLSHRERIEPDKVEESSGENQQAAFGQPLGAGRRTNSGRAREHRHCTTPPQADGKRLQLSSSCRLIPTLALGASRVFWQPLPRSSHQLTTLPQTVAAQAATPAAPSPLAFVAAFALSPARTVGQIMPQAGFAIDSTGLVYSPTVLPPTLVPPGETHLIPKNGYP